ncbi:MAG: hypothetical protein PHP28_11620 [Actinomycetota bacterium]|nr:hypothetical protein [Actinomycetota bacterium]MDD5666428.1 hypothetical protein [Actinomycetota bacterium]
MVLFRKTKRLVLLSALCYGAAVRSLHPGPRELADPAWHREAPIRLLMRGLTRFLPALHDRFGERGVRALQYVFYRVGEDRAPVLREYLQIDPHDARSLGRVLDYEDGLAGVRGTWTEETKGRAVKEERYCPAARELTACPEVCTRLMMAMEAGTFSVLNPDLAVPELSQLLSKGDPCCLATIELPMARKEARKESPHATPGAFPPVLKVPGLQGKLAAQGVRSLISAAWVLLTRGPEQPMTWYEFFRYVP